MNLYDVYIFDADDTLLDFHTASYQAFINIFPELEKPKIDEFYSRYKNINNNVWEEYQNGKITAEELKSKRFRVLLEELAYKADMAELMSIRYLDMLVDNSVLLNGTIEIIHQLHMMGKTIAIATNGLKEVQYRRLEKTGLDKFISKIFISEEIGISKPHIGFFEHLHNKLGNPEKSRVLFIGDNPSSDIIGAKNFGYKTCLFQRSWHALHETCGADYTIESLIELL
jgi:5'-nucleotidase